ncbi:anaphase-promoting complex component apc8 [Sorochytrium milnesiophthora]
MSIAASSAGERGGPLDADSDRSDVCEQLHLAIEECRDRGLLFSARWLAQLLMSTGSPLDAPYKPFASTEQSPWTTQTQYDRYVLAKQYFDLREFERCMHTLQRDNAVVDHPKSLFLLYYARFLDGERQKEETLDDDLKEAQSPLFLNQQLRPIHDALQKHPLVTASQDGFLLYLLGMVQARLGSVQDARDTLIAAVNQHPYNWSAWVELSRLMTSNDVLNATRAKIGRHFMADFFLLQTLAEGNFSLHPHTGLDTEAIFERLTKSFSDQCPHIDQYRAQIAYLERDLGYSIDIFGGLLQQDPYRLDSMDVYANALYVNDSGAELSYLAHNAVLIDRHRPETNVIIGNHMSKKGDHVKAVYHFQRALRLNRGYVTAWILLGHEYLELIQPEAAAQSYRAAIDLNPRDYRSWYGLGQVYHLLNMFPYACEYLQRALAINPLDSRMWYLLGQCYLGMRKYDDALRSLKRSIAAINKAAEQHAPVQSTPLAASKARRSRTTPVSLGRKASRHSSSSSSSSGAGEPSAAVVAVQHEPNVWAHIGLIYANHYKDRAKARVYLQQAWELRAGAPMLIAATRAPATSRDNATPLSSSSSSSSLAVTQELSRHATPGTPSRHDLSLDQEREVEEEDSGGKDQQAAPPTTSAAAAVGALILKRDLLVQCAMFLAVESIRDGDVMNANEYLSCATRYGDGGDQARVREIQDAVTQMVERGGPVSTIMLEQAAASVQENDGLSGSLEDVSGFDEDDDMDVDFV